MMRNKPPRRTKKGLLVGFLSAAVLTLSGCVKAQVEYEFQEDNTVSMHMLIMEQEETKGMFYSSEEELEEQCKQAVEELDTSDDEGENSEKEYEVVVDDEGLSGCRITVHGMEIPVLDADDDEASGRIGDEFILRGDSFDLIPTGLDEAPEGFPQPEVAMRFTFPGKISEATIGEISEDKRSVTITDFTAASGDPFEIRASAVPSDGFSLTSIIVTAAGVVLVLGVVLGGLFLLKRNRDDDDDDDDDEYDDDDDDDDDDGNGYAAQQYQHQDYAQEQQIPHQQYAAMSQQPYAPVTQPPHEFQQQQYREQEEGQYSQYEGDQYPQQQYTEQYPEYEEEENSFIPPPPPPPADSPAPAPASPQPARAPLPPPRAKQTAPAPRQAPAAPQGLPKPAGGLPGAPAPRPGGNGQGGAQQGVPKKLPPLPPPPPRFKK